MELEQYLCKISSTLLIFKMSSCSMYYVIYFLMHLLCYNGKFLISRPTDIMQLLETHAKHLFVIS